MERQITLPLDAPALVHGAGFFETLLVVDGTALSLHEHCQRLIGSAVTLDLPSPSREELAGSVTRTLATRGECSGEYALRILWIATGQPIEERSSWELHATLAPLSPSSLRRRRLGRVILLPARHRRSEPEHKTISYFGTLLAARKAMATGADEALFTTDAGEILEGTATNVFALADDELITAPVDAGILPGVTRAWVIDRAAAAGLKVVQRCPVKEELLAGSFMSGSLTTLAPIRSVDHEPCAEPGAPFAELRRLYEVKFLRRE
jgi:branched-subunit amino acid aminotransferase/4-amino-4-deoxychorismate lyase